LKSVSCITEYAAILLERAQRSRSKDDYENLSQFLKDIKKLDVEFVDLYYYKAKACLFENATEQAISYFKYEPVMNNRKAASFNSQLAISELKLFSLRDQKKDSLALMKWFG
jgi:hypothetical protein